MQYHEYNDSKYSFAMRRTNSKVEFTSVPHFFELKQNAEIFKQTYIPRREKCP